MTFHFHPLFCYAPYLFFLKQHLIKVIERASEILDTNSTLTWKIALKDFMIHYRLIEMCPADDNILKKFPIERSQ
jgi:hypothetical protein